MCKNKKHFFLVLILAYFMSAQYVMAARVKTGFSASLSEPKESIFKKLTSRLGIGNKNDTADQSTTNVTENTALNNSDIKNSAHVLGLWTMASSAGGALVGYIVGPVVTQYSKKVFDKKFASRLQYEEIDYDGDCKDEVFINAEARETLDEAIAVMTNGKSQVFSMPNMMFYGPPGTGKTMMVKNIAQKNKLKMIAMSASAWYGLSTKEAIEQMNRLFKALEKVDRKTIVFLDEADSLLMSRSELSTDQSKILTHFLSKTGNLSEHVSFIFATNRASRIDSAMRSRITYKIQFDLPALPVREQLVKHYFVSTYEKLLKAFKAENKETLASESIEWILANASNLAEQLDGFSGRDIMQASSRLQYKILAYKGMPDIDTLETMINNILAKMKEEKQSLTDDA